MEDEGLVSKGSENSSLDIYLTEKGMEMMSKVEEAWDKFHQKCDNILTEEHKNKVNKELQEVDTIFLSSKDD